MIDNTYIRVYVSKSLIKELQVKWAKTRQVSVETAVHKPNLELVDWACQQTIGEHQK